jgi:hypothetical protein
MLGVLRHYYPTNCSSQEIEVFFKCKKGQEGEKIPNKHCVPEPPPVSKKLLILTKAELVTPTVTIGIAAKPLHKKNQGKNKNLKTPKQNKTKKTN